MRMKEASLAPPPKLGVSFPSILHASAGLFQHWVFHDNFTDGHEHQLMVPSTRLESG
jgi:hypothetical protein